MAGAGTLGTKRASSRKRGRGRVGNLSDHRLSAEPATGLTKAFKIFAPLPGKGQTPEAGEGVDSQRPSPGKQARVEE